MGPGRQGRSWVPGGADYPAGGQLIRRSARRMNCEERRDEQAEGSTGEPEPRPREGPRGRRRRLMSVFLGRALGVALLLAGAVVFVWLAWRTRRWW